MQDFAYPLRRALISRVVTPITHSSRNRTLAFKLKRLQALLRATLPATPGHLR